MFVGSMIPNWLQCRAEISQGAKLAYARLAQYAGERGKCFPKQRTLATELGVSERTVRDYLRELVEFALIESEQRGLKKSNLYFFLDHPWIYEGQPSSGQDRQKSSAPERQETSAPYAKENQQEESPRKRIIEGPHSPPKGDCVKDTGSSSQEEEIYAAYPRKVSRPPALRAIRRALAQKPFDFLLERTRLFAKTCNSPVEFIPYPATWFNGERYNDDPATWRRTVGASGKSLPAIVRPDKFGCGVSKL